MKLPQISYPIYEVQLLSQKDPVKIRPFTVREEKLMLMAVTAKDLKSTIDALKQIINNCVIGELDVDQIAMVDMEILFCNLRARSIGEKGQQVFKCKNELVVPTSSAIPQETKPCNMLIQVPIDYLNVPIINKDTERKIKFTDEMGVVMKFPTFALIQQLTTAKEEDVEYAIAANCLDMIYDKDSVYYAKDCTQDELIEYILGLPGDKYELIKEFCNQVPQSKLIVEKDCTKCGFHHTFTLEGIEDFFG